MQAPVCLHGRSLRRQSSLACTAKACLVENRLRSAFPQSIRRRQSAECIQLYCKSQVNPLPEAGWNRRVRSSHYGIMVSSIRGGGDCEAVARRKHAEMTESKRRAILGQELKLPGTVKPNAGHVEMATPGNPLAVRIASRFRASFASLSRYYWRRGRAVMRHSAALSSEVSLHSCMITCSSSFLILTPA